MPRSSLRLDRAESSRLAWALVISVACHLLAYSGYETGRRLHWWENWQWPAWMVAPRMLTELFVKPPTARQLEQLRKQRQEQTPLIFVEVSPAQATPEPPKKADYYSDKNSLAANPDTTIQSTVPKIDGKQTEVAKTEDVPRPKPFPLQPARPATPAVQPPAEPSQEAKPKPTLASGDLTVGRPEEVARKGEGQAERPKRRRLEDVPPEERAAALAGQKMKQEGGVGRHTLEMSSLDVRATPFGSYDAKIVYAVQKRWYELLEEQRFAGARTGKVVLQFHLNSDGTVSQMRLMENTVDLTLALICQSAVRDPAPFAPWPGDLRRLVGIDYREVMFTFYYR
ncbi:MAG: hypothetical protein ABSF95_23060 [Verrucomicrobiota bacterium]|jgi:hypothetical protein